MKTDLGKAILKGGIILTLSRLLNRLFSLIRIFTIARWIGPESMGIFSVASLILATIEQVSASGFPHSLIQKQGDISRFIPPVRTFQAIRGVFIGLLLFTSSSFIANFFNSPESSSIIKIISLVPIINGFEPLFFILSQKELKFEKIVILQISASIIGLLVGLFCAYLDPSPWCLIWSVLSVSLSTTIGAHILSSRANIGFTLNFKPLIEILPFGLWMLVISISALIYTKLGDWIIGSFLDVTSLAIYQMAFLICTIATYEIGSVISQLSFPVFSKIQDNINKLQNAFVKSFCIVSIMTIPTAALLSFTSYDIVLISLGSDWLDVAPLIPFLSIWGICSLFAGPQSALFKAIGEVKIWALTVIFMSLILLIGIIPMVNLYGTKGVCILIAVVGLFMQFIRYYYISNFLNLSYFNVIKHLVLPIVSVIITFSFTHYIINYLFINSLHLRLIVTAFIFLTIYFSTTFLLMIKFDPLLYNEILKRFKIRNVFINADS